MDVWSGGTSCGIVDLSFTFLVSATIRYFVAIRGIKPFTIHTKADWGQIVTFASSCLSGSSWDLLDPALGSFVSGLTNHFLPIFFVEQAEALSDCSPSIYILHFSMVLEQILVWMGAYIVMPYFQADIAIVRDPIIPHVLIKNFTEWILYLHNLWQWPCDIHLDEDPGIQNPLYSFSTNISINGIAQSTTYPIKQILSPKIHRWIGKFYP